MEGDAFLTYGAAFVSILSVGAAFLKLISTRHDRSDISRKVTIETDGSKIELTSTKPEDLDRLLRLFQSKTLTQEDFTGSKAPAKEMSVKTPQTRKKHRR